MSLSIDQSLKGGGSSETRGGTIRKSRKTKKERIEANKERQKKALSQLIEENKRISLKAKNKRKKKEPIGEFWGDTPVNDQEWPNSKDSKTIRFFGQNTNGISYHNKYLDWGMTLQTLHEYQADIAGLVEVNLDMNNQTVKKTLYDKLNNFDKYAKMAMSYSGQSYSTSPYKPGGTVTLVRGNRSGRIIKKGQDNLGRWSYVTLEEKSDIKIMFLTFYRVCKKGSETGGYTIRTQQERDLYAKRKSHQEPREAILIDLEKEITNKHNEGFNIFVFGDINDEVRSEKRVQDFLQKSKLKNIMTTRFTNQTLPSTYARGPRCLDLMGMSEGLDDSVIIRCGIFPMYHGMPADHRAFYADLDIEKLFKSTHSGLGHRNFKRFNTSQVKKCNNYLYHLESLLEENRIPQKIDTLEKQMLEYLENKVGNLDEMVASCKILFNKTTELMLASDKKSGRAHYVEGKAASPKLAEAAKDVKECRRLVSIEKNKKPKNEELINEYGTLLKTAKNKLKEVQKNAEK